ncbi:MAG: collagen binding domain-containing protein [Thermoplasmata archaeon]
MKPYVLALLIASILAISSLGIGVTVIHGASSIREDSDNDTCYYDITVFKYYDENQNGIYDEGEEGLEDWYFELYGKGYENGDDKDHQPWYYLESGYTDSDGYIVFEDYECGFPNDEIGHYKVREYIPEGWYNTGSAVYGTEEEVETEYTITENGEMEMTIRNGEEDEDRYVEDSFWLREPMTVEFGNTMMDGEITVYKYYDVNEDGEFDEEEDYMLEDWMFNLWTTEDEEPDEIIDMGETDENGALTFEDVYPGEYIVQEELKEDWEHTTDLLQPVTVYPAEESEVWFGNVQYGDITVNKFHDVNYNGEYDDGEELIDGFWFQLWEAYENGQPIKNGRIGKPVETNDGTYTFEDLVAGDYVVQELDEYPEGECCWLPTTDVLQHTYVKPGGEYNLYFGNVQGGMIEGMKFLDIEADGHFDVGLDKPLMGWEINLWTVEDGVPGEIIETTETNRDGMYYFDCVMPGEYFVQEEMYEGWYNNTADILHVDVEPCETVEGVDFSNCMYKEIYGIKFYDYNMDGEFNEEDWVLEGWEINLWNEIDGEPGEIIDTFYTQPNGYYFFDGIKVGTYYVQEEVPYGWDNTTESIVKIEFNCCSPKEIINFGNYEFPEITINKFNDANMDGIYNIDDGDYLLADQTVNFDVLGEFEGVQVFAGTFGVEGSYNFLVPIGDFNVTEMLDIGWLNTTPLWQEQTLGPGDHWDLWFGNVQYGDIEVYKFYDYNMNGMYDKGEEMLESWTFNLWDEDITEILATNMTDEDGLAMFEDVLPGDYIVEEELKRCWFNTTPLLQSVSVEAGNTSELWFGNVPGGSIEGYKFCDYNMNGEFDEIEYGLEGWTINLYEYHEENEDEIHSMHKPYMTTETDEDGYYSFSCIKPGMYILEEVLLEGWYNTTPYYYEIEVLPEGELEYHFGNYRHGDIVGLKYYDFDMNGEFDPEVGDIPLRGKIVELWEADVEGNVIGTEAIDSTETDEHGYYSFEDVGPGDYVVYQPKACCEWEHTTPREVHVRLGCVEDVTVNYGEYQLSSIDVYVIGGMEGIGVTIYESDEDGVEGSEIESGETGDHGYYISDQLEPGYFLVVLEDGQSEHVQLRRGEQVEFEYEEEINSQTFEEATYAKIE